jgi:DEAD/DEAH box helicase domain-containing protein
MGRQENLLKSLELLRDLSLKSDSLRTIKHLPAQEGSYKDYPKDIHPALVKARDGGGFEATKVSLMLRPLASTAA